MRWPSGSSLLVLVLLAVACGGSPSSGTPTGGAPAAGPEDAGQAGSGSPAPTQPAQGQVVLAPTPPMGWNDWSHYQCAVDEQVVVHNAQALVSSGLAAKGYDTVTVDDCWMAMSRDANGNLVADSGKFPHGMAWLGQTLHAMGLQFGIYEDAGATTCGGFPGSGRPQGGGNDHFVQDANLFASWGVDYLKLDGCDVWVPPGQSMEQTYRDAYAAQSAALAGTGRKIVFSESAPAYFNHTPQWLSVLGWVGAYGQLWRVGTDIQIYDAWNPNASRWNSVLTNYAETRDKAQFAHPGNWNDPDFIIAGDPGITFEESRSQFTVWTMMAAPLILSSDLTQVTQNAQVTAMLGNADVIAIDQDPLGEPARVSVGNDVDVLVRRLANGDRAVALFNHGDAATTASAATEALGFDNCASCTYAITNVWEGAHAANMAAALPAHGAALFRVRQIH